MGRNYSVVLHIKPKLHQDHFVRLLALSGNFIDTTNIKHTFQLRKIKEVKLCGFKFIYLI